MSDIVMNPRVAEIRARTGLGAPLESFVETEGGRAEIVEFVELPRSGCTVSDRMCNLVLSVLKFSGPKDQKELAEILGVGRSTVSSAVKVLKEGGAVSYTGKPMAKVYYESTPAGWVLDPHAVGDKMPIPTYEAKKETAPDYADNPLTWMLSKKNPTVQLSSIEAYERFIKDTAHFYNKELDAVITVLHDLCKDRIISASADCPVCGARIIRDGTAVRCKKCNLTIDRGEVMASFNTYLKTVKVLMGVDE